MIYPKDVVDERGNVHVLTTPPLGEGGQGIVFATKNPDIAVKLISTGETSNPERRQPLLEQLTRGLGRPIETDDGAHHRLRNRLSQVRTLPLPDLHIAQPLELLRGYVGYTMRLLRDMVPIRTLILPPAVENAAVEYLAAGGLRRRLRLLAKTAETLGRLHAIPLVYADVSPNNIFVSSDTGANESWLIDADNLHFQSMPGPSIYTPGFGAPEIVGGHASVSTLSDAYAFAVLSFYVIAQTHPFLGDQVDEGGWEASVDLEEQAFAGKLPWVEDEEDDSNWSDKGVPRDLVLTPRLRKLYQRTFGPGRNDSSKRPGLLEWAEVLYQAADLTVTCRECRSTFYVPCKTCPWCSSSPSAELLYAEFRAWDPELDSETYEAVLASRPVWRMCLDLDTESTIHRHATEPSLLRDGDPPVMNVEPRRRSIRITPLTDSPIFAVLPHEGRTVQIDHQMDLPLPVAGREWHMHFGAPDGLHRMASFKQIGARKR